MMIDKLRLYHALPHPLRMIAASVRGYELRRWRYGVETELLVDQALDREYWSSHQWQSWQEERLAFILHRAATLVPFYREQWAKRRRQGDRAAWDVLSNWPALGKQAVRKNPQAFISEDCHVSRMYHDHTGGTTGTPLDIYLKKETIIAWYALFEARVRHWHGVTRNQTWAILGGQMVVPFTQLRPPFWIYNAGLNQLYLSTFHIKIENAAAYAHALSHYHPSHLIVYPSAAAELARCFLSAGLKPPPVSVVFSNSEPLLPAQQSIISQMFGCPVRNTYGMAEIVLGASECKCGNLHFWPETGVYELGEVEADASYDEARPILSTGLLNPDMPLVRYETGDRGHKLQESDCTCGRRLPIMPTIEGRMSDMLLTIDNRRIYWLNPVFYNLPIVEAQIIQEANLDIRVNIVPTTDFNLETEVEIIRRLQLRVGKLKINIDRIVTIPREKNGKIRPVISHVKSEPGTSQA